MIRRYKITLDEFGSLQVTADHWRLRSGVRKTKAKGAVAGHSSNRIRELREAQGLSLAQLAERLGTTNQQISHLELGKRQLTVSWLRRLGAALGCHPWEVVEEAATSRPSADVRPND